MKEYNVFSIAELEAILSEAGPDVFYRGQTKHYGDPAAPSVTTSFDRLGCVPDEMGKWIYYASNALEGWLGKSARSMEFSQAVLQHYGWRSFYIDVTSRPAVAAWFASHVYKDGHGIDSCEDCFETWVWLRKKRASYEFQNGTGHLYLIKKPASSDSVHAIDLSTIHIEGARPRSSAQSAWLLGPLRHAPLPTHFYVAKINAERVLLRDYAAKHSFDTVESLFPARREDPILNSLLCLPWTEIDGVNKPGEKVFVNAFRRTIEFPEYDGDFDKILPPHIALYRHAKVSDFSTIDGAISGIAFEVPELAIFGTANPTGTKFPRILALIEKHASVTFEIDQLIRHIQQENTYTYGKGVNVTRTEDGLLNVCELTVDHPGMKMIGAGLNYGWHYAVDKDGIWSRRTHENDCPCLNNYVHERHMSALTIIEEWLENPDAFNS